MTLRTIKKESLQAGSITIFFSLVNHGLILLNEGVFWDDWINFIALLDKDWEKLFFVYSKAGGIPLTAYVHWMFGYAPNIVFTYRLVAILCIAGSAFLIYCIGRHKLYLSQSLAVLAAVLALSYPAYQMSATIVGTVLWVYYLFFLIGASLALLGFELQGTKAVIIRLVALVFLFLSYRFEVLLLLSYGIVLIEVFSKIKDKRDLLNFLNVNYLFKRADLLALPLIYWVYSHTAFAAPVNANYNQFDFESTGSAMIGFLNNTFLQQTLRIGEILRFIWPFVLIAFPIGWLLVKKVNLFSSQKKTNINSSLLFLGLVLFLLALIPPVLVGKTASAVGYGTRHALGLGWPVGLLIVTISSLLVTRFPKTKTPVSAFLVFLLFAFAATNSFTYLTWQARWAKDQSVIQHLGSSAQAKNYSVYLVEDNVAVPGLENYRFYEWAGIFRLIWGDETRVGVQDGYYTPEALMDVSPVFLKHYNTELANLNGCYARLQINENLKMALPEVGLRYILYRFVYQEKLSEFLNDLTQVKVSPMESDFETDCHVN